MEEKKFKKILIDGLKINKILINDLNDKKINLLYSYMKYILEKNKYINLTNITDEVDFIYKHYIDSLYISKYIKKGKIIDIGTGAGFPGIPLLFTLNEISIDFLDARLKKLNVIDEFLEQTNYTYNIVHARAEVINKKKGYNSSYDYVTTRAVSDLKSVKDYSLPFLKNDGLAIAMRGKLDISTLDENLVEKYYIYNDVKNEKYERTIHLFKK